MNSKPLQYESLKTVIQYMDANKRFKISHRCPSIEKTERIVPLHIKNLTFRPPFLSPSTVSINSTEYKTGTIRVYSPGVQILKRHQQDNENGGVGRDLDQFGFSDIASFDWITPGDIVFDGIGNYVMRELSEQILEATEKSILVMEAVLDRMLNGEVVTDLIWGSTCPYAQNFNTYLVPANHRSVEQIEEIIEKRRACILPFQNRRDNTPAVFTTKVQLTVTSGNGFKSIQHYPGRKVCQVEKRLNEFLFSGRKRISVRCLAIDTESSVLRLPLGISFRIQDLRVIKNVFYVCKTISHIIHPSCLPLNTFQIDLLEYGVSKQAIVKSARKLRVKVPHIFNELLEHVTNRYFEARYAYFVAQEYVRLARNWLETGRPAGTCYSFGIKNKRLIKKTIERIRRELNGEMFGREYCKVPMTTSSQLRVYFRKRRSQAEGQTTWKFVFEVVGV